MAFSLPKKNSGVKHLWDIGEEEMLREDLGIYRIMAVAAMACNRYPAEMLFFESFVHQQGQEDWWRECNSYLVKMAERVQLLVMTE